MDGKLVFVSPADGSGRLVFGEAGEEVVPDAVFSLDADLPGLGTLTLRAGAVLALDADLPGLDGTIGLEWDANVSRGMWAELQSGWQEGQAVAVGVSGRWQESSPLRSAAQARWQPGQRMAAVMSARWEETERLRAVVATGWQEGVQRRATVATGWQETHRLRAANLLAWQEGAGLRAGVVSAWQEQLRLRAAVSTWWQATTVPLRRAATAHWSHGVPVHVDLRTHWQEARRPPAGVSALPPVDPPEPPCYDPATVGRLVFADAWLGDGRLVFVCQRAGPGPEPGATVVVPIQRVYMTINNVSLHRVDGNVSIPAYSFGMSLDVDSWTWGWQATLHADALPLIQPDAGGDPVDILATINGVPYRLLAESYSRQRQFGNTRISVKGRGRAAMLDAPYAPVLNHGNSLGRTAEQLMGEVLTLNGVGIGWDVEFGLQDWLVPGNVWTHQGTYVSALQDIAQAVGGYLQPHDTAQSLRVLRRYPAAPWDWATLLTPDYELPSAVVAVEGIDWRRLPAYDRVYVEGVKDGVRGKVTRTGTAGAQLAPMVVHPLITHADAARQRGIAELGNTGSQAYISLRLPVLEETGVIKPGALVRYVDGADTHLGLVRSTAVEWAWPTLRQVLTVETHLAE